MNAIVKLTKSPANSRDGYVKQIQIQLEKTLAGFIEIGRLLAEAEKVLGRKKWLEMVNNDLPFSRRTAEKLIRIAADRRLSDPRYINKLPPHWTSLHELTYLDNEQFERGIIEGVIHPDAERKDISALKSPTKSASTATPRKGTRSHAEASRTVAAANIGARSPLEYQDRPRIGIIDLFTRFCNTLDGIESFKNDVQELVGKYRLNIDPSELVRLAQIYFFENQLFQLKSELERNTVDNPIADVEDAFFQIATGRKLQIQSDGNFVESDLRHSKNQYAGMTFEELEAYCIELRICTKYTPIEALDDQAFTWMMAWRYLTGDQNEREAAREALTTRAEDKSFAKSVLELIQ